MAKRGRPVGHKLSEATKQQISMTKTGQLHKPKTRRKISKTLKKYYSSPEGILQREKTRAFLTGFWSSDEGYVFRETLGNSMKEYYDEHFRN